jgi:hypothetical protein
MRHIPEAVTWVTGFISAFWVSLYFSSNKTLGIWSLFGAVVFGALTCFILWQNDIWKTMASVAENEKTQADPQNETRHQHDESSKIELKAIKSKHDKPPQRVDKLEVGEDSVVMGNVPPNTKVGNGSVIIGPTDNRGNTIINTPMAVGRGAKAGPGSIAIGANAGAGLNQDLPAQK